MVEFEPDATPIADPCRASSTRSGSLSTTRAFNMVLGKPGKLGDAIIEKIGHSEGWADAWP